MSSLSTREKELRLRLKNDFPIYAGSCLKIRTKTGTIESLRLNRAQTFVHERLEQQRSEIGKVRALILKGRQQGISTYIGGRFYHRVTHEKGKRVFILTHEDKATQNLFDMVDRYHTNCPDIVRPVTGAANAKELSFPVLDSGYAVGTAGTKAVGRSNTIQYFHGSEVAFWPNADTHASGVMQAVPDMPGTEVILESTANGLGNFYHQLWQDAEEGKGDYIAIFVPWYWQDEYIRSVPPNFALTDEDEEYRAAYGLSMEQMAWRAWKTLELRSDLLFRQEYPATAAEAFQLTGHDSFIAPAVVLKARKTTFITPATGPLIIGFDPAWTGGDRHAMAWRRGRRLIQVKSRTGLTVTESAGWAAKVIREDKPAKMFIDVGGVGAGVYDILCEQGFEEYVVAVNFGSKPFEQNDDEGGGPANRRAEMWQNSKDWLSDPAGVSIPDSDSLQADACGPSYSYDSLSRLLIEKKEHMVKRGVKSPDEWDAVALTFAEPVFEESLERQKPNRRDNRYIV